MCEQVGQRIRQLRKEYNLSRAQFGNMIGVSGQYIGQIERDSHAISGTTIAKICSATGVSSDYILFGAASPVSTAAALDGLSEEQIRIAFDMLGRLAQLVNTTNGNNALIQEVLQQCP